MLGGPFLRLGIPEERLLFVLFFFQEKKCVQSHQKPWAPSSQMTSVVDGTSHQTPDLLDVPRGQHAKTVHHRLNHALLAAARIPDPHSGQLPEERVGLLAPVSHATTTSLARPCSPVSSGWVRSLVRPAWSKAAPSHSAHCLLGAPSAMTG